MKKRSTMQMGEIAAAYIPVDSDFRWKNKTGEMELDDNFVFGAESDSEKFCSESKGA